MNRKVINHSPNDTSQLDKFKDAARSLDCDEDEAAFEDKLKKIAKTEPAKDDTAKSQD